MKKKQSAAIFKYFVEADSSKQTDMNVNIDLAFQEMWKTALAETPAKKLDDVVDALLHALNGILCKGSRYQQLIPSSSSLHSNRTIAMAILPDITCWTAIHCT
jgi:hypothetical protein